MLARGGHLDDWNFNPSPSPSTSSIIAGHQQCKMSSCRRGERRKGAMLVSSRDRYSDNGGSFAYSYPQGQIESPIVLNDSCEGTSIVAFVDRTPYTDSIGSVPSYDYDSSVFSGWHFASGSREQEDEEEGMVGVEVETEEEEVGVVAGSYPSSQRKKDKKKNEGFLSIGGLKLYTVDMSSSEEDDNGIMDDEEEEDGKCDSDSNEGSILDSEEEEGSDNRSLSSYDFYDSDVDEEVMEDYLEGIGGVSKLFQGGYLEKNLDLSSDGYDVCKGGISRKLGAFGLINASKKYCTKKLRQRNNRSSGSDIETQADKYRTLILDDILCERNNGGVSGKIRNNYSQLSCSWPSDAHKSTKYKEIRGGKKKHRKGLIALKSRDCMQNHGVGSEKTNLRSNKSASASAKGRTKIRDFQKSAPSKLMKKSGRCKSNDEDGRKEFRRKTKASCASRPVTFIPSGIMKDDSLEATQNDAIEAMQVDSPEQSSSEMMFAIDSSATFVSENFGNNSQKMGSFEMHTKGFGSRMMAKMGFVEGAGLGKDGQGIVQPIKAIKRPKSLGLGIQFTETSEPEKNSLDRRKVESAIKPTKANSCLMSASDDTLLSNGSISSRKRAQRDRIGALKSTPSVLGQR